MPAAGDGGLHTFSFNTSCLFGLLTNIICLIQVHDPVSRSPTSYPQHTILLCLYTFLLHAHRLQAPNHYSILFIFSLEKPFNEELTVHPGFSPGKCYTVGWYIY
jgi:hypothetical protein